MAANQSGSAKRHGLPEDLFDGSVARQSKNVVSMPESVKQQTPGRLMTPFQVSEGTSDVLSVKYCADPGLTRNQTLEHRQSSCQPFADGWVKADLPVIWLSGRDINRHPIAKQPLCHSRGSLDSIRQAKSKISDYGIEKWRPALNTVCHQTSIDLD